ncbi:Hypothetical Protein CGB_A7160C [Cryptococcus gattii WM276]|uniref:Uncharacterized protein n=1 Tax=Cryptococcus gattii serotype B (strain WM276 / ATCC MYA-4071) TaxID=367775 RepID=E6QYB0_CRYGW|nr:Hypothetical Protein CGB_A7160C [Cryptococcus gattii WM276]ADV19882.1 Hypothetical Protein CGB_A7160C [Cryptococcus gattii WM276]KJE03126.1 hypothetical protein I311_03183 [Cryptococcus gattii NT-10]
MSSPTLSETEFDDLEAPRVTLAMINGLETNGSNLSSSIAPPSGPIATKPKMKKVKKARVLTRYLSPLKEEAFVGPLLPSVQDTVMLIQEQCPSLSAVPSSCISLHLRFDGNTQHAVKDVLFKVLPSAWPGAVSEILPLVYIKVKNQDAKVERPASAQCDNGNKGTCNACQRMASHPKTGGGVTQTQADKHPELKPGVPIGDLTWDDLKKNGTLLGVQSSWRDDRATGCSSRRALLD